MTLPAVHRNKLLGRWDPFREFEDLYRWMDSVTLPVERNTWAPLADVTESDDAYTLEIDVPGVRREDITIDLGVGELAVSGELKEKERVGLLRHRTRRIGRFSYRVTLPDRVDGDKVEASLDHGVLTIRVPKSEAAKPRRIEITGK